MTTPNILIAIDTETCLISYPDNVNPKGICLSSYDGKETGLYNLKSDKELVKTKLLEWLTDDRYTLVGHNISFDLHVLLRTFPDLWPKVWKAIKKGKISDTLIREKLKMLSTEGNTRYKPASLAAVVDRYLDIDMSSSKQGEDIWRLRYSELEDVPVEEWPKEASEYAINDAVYTWRVWKKQQEQSHVSGPGSIRSEELQLAASFSLLGMTIQGICLDQDHVKKIEKEVSGKYEKALAELKEYGLVRDNGTRDQKQLEALCKELGVETTTKSGRISTDKKTIMQLSSKDPRLEAYREYSHYLKAVTTFIPQMKFDRVHPRFNAMVNTLRTSCSASNYYKYQGNDYGKKVIRKGDPYPSINLQQIPRSSEFRRCFVPEEGHLFICADYANLELVCAAQTYYRIFKESKLRELLNEGHNLHDCTGTIIYNDYKKQSITREQFIDLVKQGDKEAKFCRQSAKFVNLGCPGGQSAGTIHKLANGLGIPITPEQAVVWREAACLQFPEFSRFFDEWFPNLRTGYMYISVDGEYKRVTRYDAEICGIWKAKSTYTAMANSISMQMPAAIGKKYAMVALYEQCTNPEAGSVLFGCKLHLDMHDEFLLSAPEAKAKECEAAMTDIMIDGMQKVLPDMRVGVESMLLRRWNKDSEEEFGSNVFNKPPKRSEVKNG